MKSYKEKAILKEINMLISKKKYQDAIAELNKVITERPELESLKSLKKFCELKIKNVISSKSVDDFVIEKIENKNRLCVCLNVTSCELEKIKNLLKIWKLFTNAALEISPIADLKFCFNKLNDLDRDNLTHLIDESGIKSLFLRVEIISLDIPEKYDFYKRDIDGSVDVKDNKYGYKSGPNFQFFSIFKNKSLQGYDFVLLIESDCFPTRPDWIKSIFDEAEKKFPFWVLGSPFMGQSKIGPDIALHINGVAVYATSHYEFYLLLEKWEERLQNLTEQHPNLAYDWALEAYFNNVISIQNWNQMSSKDIQEYIKYRKMFLFANSIVNLAGEAERGGVQRYKFNTLNQIFPGISLVHGDYFEQEALNQALNLQISYLNKSNA
jgi:hypothetical protein